MRPRARVERPVSAGGVIYRDSGSGVDVLLCGRHSPAIWALPKGTPDPGETREQTAVRETSEETGLEVDLEGFIDSIDYWFVRASDRVRCHKTVYFYRMSVAGGDIAGHDAEFDEVRWFPIEQALKNMTYGNEAKVVEKGLAVASG